MCNQYYVGGTADLDQLSAVCKATNTSTFCECNTSTIDQRSAGKNKTLWSTFCSVYHMPFKRTTFCKDRAMNIQHLGVISDSDKYYVGCNIPSQTSESGKSD